MKRKILFVAGGAYVSGLEIVTLHLIREMKDNGDDVLCLVNGWNDGVFKQALEKMNVPYEEAKLGWIYFRKPLWTLDTLVHLPGAYSKTRRIIREFNPDIIHFCSYAPVLLLYPLWKKNNCVYNLQEPHEPNKKNLYIYRILNKKIRIFTAVSGYIKKVLTDLNIPEQKIRVVFNGVPAIQDAPANNAGSTNAGGTVVFGIIGQVAPWKGHETLVEAIGRISGSPHPPFLVRIFGNDRNPYAEQVRKMIKEKGLEKYFSWEGFVNDQDLIYRQVDAVIVPSLSQEPCSLTILESMMRGKALIVSDRGGNPELIEDNRTGLIFKADDPVRLAATITELLDSTTLIPEMGTAAHRAALAKFTDRRMAADYIGFYGEIA
jgi:glycosyltransferase involved in cell wall biosynthesis